MLNLLCARQFAENQIIYTKNCISPKITPEEIHVNASLLYKKTLKFLSMIFL